MAEDAIVNIRTARWGSYLIAFVITAFIFATALFASNYFNNQRIAEVRATQDNISIDILSTETQFQLLAEHSCQDLTENSALSSEIRPLAQRLSYLEAQSNVNQEELARLKRYYSLFQIKDYLLMQQVAQKCNLKPVFVLYFYSNQGDCPACEQQGYMLTALQQQYPMLRVYSFDYNLDVSAVQTLVQINDIKDQLPALVIKGKVYYGLQTITDIQKILPELAKLATSTAATTTKLR